LSFSLLHWLLVVVIVASPIMGIIRGVRNGSVANALLSVLLPVYGLVYFFVARRPDIAK